MSIEEMVEEFAAEHKRLEGAPVCESEKFILRKFATYIKDSGYLEAALY